MGRRKTHDEFIEDVYKVWEDEITVISEYKGTLNKVKVRHNSELCGGHEYEVRASSLLSLDGCPRCKRIKNGSHLRMSIDDVKNDLYKYKGNEFEILSKEYINNDTKMLVKHNKKGCNRTFYITRSALFRNKNICSHCGIKKKPSIKITPVEYEKKFASKLGEGFTLLSTYTKNTDKVKVRHVCGYEQWVRPLVFLERGNCNKCIKNELIKKMLKTTEEFKKEVYLKYGDEFSILEDYKGVKKPIKVRHNSENCKYHIFKVTPGGFLTKKGSTCPKCSKVYKRTSEDFREEINKLYNNEYTVIGKFKNIISEIEVQHNSEHCNNYLYKVKPVSLLNGGGQCPICYKVNRSNGESKIELFLKKLRVKYKRELVLFKSDVGGSPRFDFGIYDNDDVLLGLIEFDGIQHFKNVEFFYSGENDSLKRRLELDNMKNTYAKDKCIPLLRIKYDEYFSIDDILIGFLRNIGVYNDLKLSDI